MNLKSYCLRNHGVQKRLAAACGVSVGFVNHWVSGCRPVPVKYCALIEEFTQGEVTRKDLRPDDWHLIWQDLVQAV